MELKLNEQGLIPAIIQDVNTREVLMLGYVSPGSLKQTVKGGQVWFYSRSREELWHKGETSGNYLNFRKAKMDCDGDTLLLLVEPTGPACHTGKTSCFFKRLPSSPKFQRERASIGILDELFSVIQERKKEMPKGSYTSQLFKKGTPRIAQKVIEEAGEMALAASTGEKEQTVREAADLLYHTLVLLAAVGLKPKQVWQELAARRAG